MPDAGETLRGADPVNDELEVGFDSQFETRWHRWELAGRVVLAVVVVAGLAGLFGSGPFSHRSATFASGGISRIDFEPIARFGTPTQITFHLRPGSGASNALGNGQSHCVDLTLSSAFIEPFGLQDTQPKPLLTTAVSGNVVLTVLAREDGKEPLVRVTGKPSKVGPLRLTAQFGHEKPVKITQFVLP